MYLLWFRTLFTLQKLFLSFRTASLYHPLTEEACGLSILKIVFACIFEVLCALLMFLDKVDT